jgi:hypothetical protein
LRTCLEAHPLVILFSPLPDENAMRTLLGSAYAEYQEHQEDRGNAGASSGSSSGNAGASSGNAGASSGGGEKAMRIDTLLYYLIMGLRQAPIHNSSSYMNVINATVERIKAFFTEHYEKNKVNLVNIEKTCGLDLTDEHNKDPSLLTFLYLSSQTPDKDNMRFQYDIEQRHQKSLKMTYSPTPTPFYDKVGNKVAEGGDHRTYHYGPFTKIYPPTDNSQTISEDSVFVEAVENRLRKGEAVTVIGYGASGSGKTTTLVYAKHNGEPGILAHVANRLIEPAGSGFTSCKVMIYELDADESPNRSPNGQCRAMSKDSPQTLTRTVLDKEGKAQTYTIPVSDCERAQPFSYTIQGGRWANASQVLLEKEIVEYIDTKRNTAPTPNNPQSSRSHVICVLTFSKGAGAGAEAAAGAAAGAAAAQGDAVFVVCDFAGVENTFMCEDPRVRETIGVKALVDPMIDKMLQKVKAMISKDIGEIPDQYFVLRDDSFPYLFYHDPPTDPRTLGKQSSFAKRIAHYATRQLPMPPRTIIEVFSDIENDCEEMYRQLDAYYKNNRRISPSNITDYRTITLDTHGKIGLKSEKISKYNDFIDSYTRIFTLYRNHTKENLEMVDLYQLVRILVWYTNNPFIKLQALFQSLVTREYDPKADTIMTKTQIEAYSKQALCDQRVKEGVFINDSLRRLRSFIATSVSATSRTPPFLDECVPLQCHPHHLHCFGQSARKEDGGPLTRLIEKSVAGKTNTFCIFTVVNLSRNANNPPPIPYVDIGSLLHVREALYPLLPGRDDSPKIQEIEAALRDVREQMGRVDLQGTLLQEFEALQSLIQRGSDVPQHLEELIQKFISHNAITTIGTIEFTDAMAKYGATQITCAPSFVKREVKKLDQSAQRSSMPITVAAQPAAQPVYRPIPGHKGVYEQTPSATSRTDPARKGGAQKVHMPTRVRRKANRRTRKKRNAT